MKQDLKSLWWPTLIQYSSQAHVMNYESYGNHSDSYAHFSFDYLNQNEHKVPSFGLLHSLSHCLSRKKLFAQFPLEFVGQRML